MAPQKLEAGDVVQVTEADPYQQHDVRRCKILSIEEPDSKYRRQSTVLWLDTGQEEGYSWKAAQGINRPLEVHGGPKLDAARAGRGDVKRNAYNGGFIWFKYLSEAGD